MYGCIINYHPTDINWMEVFYWSEFANLQQDLLSMGSFLITFALMLVGYMISILIIGLFIKVKGKNE